MLSIHAVRHIKAQGQPDGGWLELTFEGYDDESITICIYAWQGSASPSWPARFIEALQTAIAALPLAPASFVEPPLHIVEED